MASVVFTITQKIAYVPNAYVQVKGSRIFQSLRVIKFDRSEGPTTGEIPPGVSSVTIVTATSEFNQIVSAVEALQTGGSVNVTIYYGPSPSGNLLVSSVVVDGAVLRAPGAPPATL